MGTVRVLFCYWPINNIFLLRWIFFDKNQQFRFDHVFFQDLIYFETRLGYLLFTCWKCLLLFCCWTFITITASFPVLVEWQRTICRIPRHSLLCGSLQFFFFFWWRGAIRPHRRKSPTYDSFYSKNVLDVGCHTQGRLKFLIELLYSHGHGISSVVVMQLTLAVKQVLYISNPTLEFLTWMSICQSIFIVRDRISVTKILSQS
jgi:hypothetical protein